MSTPREQRTLALLLALALAYLSWIGYTRERHAWPPPEPVAPTEVEPDAPPRVVPVPIPAGDPA